MTEPNLKSARSSALERTGLPASGRTRISRASTPTEFFLEFDAFHREQRILQAEQLHIRFCFSEAATADAFRGLEIHRVSVDAAAHHVGSDWSLTLLRSLNDDQPRASTVSLTGPLG